jgi:hypothetical protein
LIIGTIYRPPNTDILEFDNVFTDILSVIRNENKLAYILGDYNVNLLNCNNHIASAEFLEMFYANDFLPMISKPTRIQNQSFTLIDNIFSNSIIHNQFISGILQTDISDHFPVFSICTDKTVQKSECTYQVRDFSSHNLVKFHNILSRFNWNLITENNDCQEAFSFFHANFSKIFNLSFPIKEVKSNSYKTRKSWLSQGIKNSIKMKNKLFIKYKRNPTDQNHMNYKIFRNKLNSIIRQTERKHYNDLLSQNKCNLRKSWSVIKDIINKNRDSLNTHFKVNDEVVTNKKFIADLFNKFFVNIGPNLSKEIPVCNTDPLEFINNTNIGRSIYLRETNNDEVEKIIKEQKSNSAGYDEITAQLLKNTYNLYLTPLVHLVNLSLNQGIFPSELKVARILPLYKSGDARLVKNYRPISILPIFSKLFERIIHDRLLEFIEKYDILNNSQFGFRKKHSTTTALIVLVDKILNGFNNGEVTLGIYLDFSKAFDTINHSILLKKLSKYGIRGIALNLLDSYLSNRRQFVSFNGCQSNSLSISCGVPQGSILGPLLFILYINDITKVSNILYPILYADDSNFFVQGSNLANMVSILNDEMIKVVNWINANQLSLNINKTLYMIFKTKKRKVAIAGDVKINNVSIQRVYDTKFLGVILDCHLLWDKHITYIRSKISKSIGIISKVKKVLGLNTLVTLYYAFVYPYLNYAVELWGSSSQQNLQTIFKVQKKIIRIICKVPYCTHSAPLFSDLKILNIFRIYEYHVSILMFKVTKGLCPQLIKEMFENDIDHMYHTRQESKYRLPLYRLSVCQKGFRYKGTSIWNVVTDVISTRFSIEIFKKHVKYHLLGNNT